MHLSQLTRLAGTAEMWERTKREGCCKCSKYVLKYVTQCNRQVTSVTLRHWYNMTDVTLSLAVKIEKTVFLLRSCPMNFRHISIIASLNMSKIWLYSSQFGMLNIRNWHQGYRYSFHLSSEDRVRCNKESWSFSFQMTAFHSNGQRYSS